MNKKLISAVIAMMICFSLYAGSITFSGGHSSVSLQNGNKSVTLTQKAKVETESFKLNADKIELYGDNYRYVKCTGNVIVVQKDKNITLTCPNLSYDRETEIINVNGWVEIDDIEDEAQLSASWLEYNTQTNIMKIQIRASIKKNTDQGLLTATADSIEFDSNNKILTMKGQSKAFWNGDNYGAAIMIIDIKNEEISLYESITGEING